jgi:hypothetical protein
MLRNYLLMARAYLSASPAPRAPRERNPTDGLVLWAWLMAVLAPIVGFVLGAICAGRGRAGHGALVMVASLVMIPLWPVMIAAVLLG